jgi:STE24 endopeptidase
LFEKLFEIPKSYYKNFHLEEKWGYNKMTMKTFVKDLVKGFILENILQVILLSAILWVI